MEGMYIAVARRARNRKMEGRRGEEDTRMDRIQGGLGGAPGGAPPLGGPPSEVKYLYLGPIGGC
jgi:hypothetical protein